MSPRNVVWVQQAVEYGRALLKPTDRAALATLLQRLGVETRWSLAHGGYGIDLTHLADVEAAAQSEGWVVRRRRPKPTGDDR